MKNCGYEYFYFCLKWLKFVGGYNFGSGKQLLAIEFDFVSINPFSRVNVGIGDSFPSEKAKLYDVISPKI